ncbi:hypothetical protein [Rhizobium sp. 3T7]|jgi:hypothetical protein|uniref:hypothetical protein n=1 Tax=Rhizobium sp. 3T7 TaxID=2874922 RepID=UPI0029624796|nr:hypothetical protein [Rhizobium sp. 3T7]
MPETKIPQLIFALNVARDMAEPEGPAADLLVFLINQAEGSEERGASARHCRRD